MSSTSAQAQPPKYDVSFRLLDFNIFDEKREKEEDLDDQDDGGLPNEEDEDLGEKKYKDAIKMFTKSLSLNRMNYDALFYRAVSNLDSN